jgi:hypothetical protein
LSNKPLSTRSLLALVAVLAAVGAIAIQATAGSAQTTPKTVHLVAQNQKKVGFFPKTRPKQGDRFGFGDAISGDDVGFDRGVCTVIGRQNLCNVSAQLSKGTIALQGFATGKNQNTPIAVIGGTGDYDGASGTAIVTDVSRSTTDITVTLK